MDLQRIAMLMASASGNGAAFSAFGEERVVTPASSTTTLTAMKLAEPHAARQIVVTVISRHYYGIGDMAATAVTVAGVSATKLVSRYNNNNYDASMWLAQVSSGATGDVVVTTGSITADVISVGTIALYGATSAVKATVSGHNVSPQLDIFGTLAVAKNGAVIGCAAISNWYPGAQVPPFDVSIKTLVSSELGSRIAVGAGYALTDSPVYPKLPAWYCAVAASFSPGTSRVSGVLFCTAYSDLDPSNGMEFVPAHKPGDLLVAFAHNTTSTTVPTLPSGWTQILAPAGAGNSAMLLAYKVATSNAEAVSGFTNANTVLVQVYHGVDTASPIGGSASNTGTSNTVTYPAITMSVTDGTSRVVCFAARKTQSGTLDNPPAGTTRRLNEYNSNGGGSQACGFDTNGGVSSWSAQNVAAGGASEGWFTCSVELKKKA